MIIGMTLICPVHAQVWNAVPASQPNPTAFSNRMEMGDLEQAKAWLKAGMSPDFMGSRIGSGLMIGAWEGNIPLMRLFVSRGADLNLTNANGETALALAAWRGQKDAVRWLVKRGAKVDAPERQWSPLHYAVFSGHEDVVDFLLARGADINALSTNGSSVLMMAVYEGHKELVDKLIKLGARTDIRNELGDTALEWAMRNNNLEIARLVSTPDAYRQALNEPREKWGTMSRSLTMSPELTSLLARRAGLAAKNKPLDEVDEQIAAERARLVRTALGRTPQRSTAIEVTASRDKPEEQSVTVVGSDGEAKKAYKVPPATYYGTPKMPPKAPVRNY